jgi:amino acid efflux transporter
MNTNPATPPPATGRPEAKLRKAIGTRHAIALYVSSVLGSGILVLPGLAAEIAGPGSLLAWGLLAVASLPFGLTFAALSARHPESGGIYGFAREAFGPSAGLVCGWLFLLWVAAGAPAVGLIGASYLGYAFSLGRPESFVLAFLIVGSTYVINYRGIVVSTRVQLAVILSIIALLVLTVALSGFQVRAANFSPFLPYGLLPVGTAAALIFWSFLGYENVSNVAEEFENPRRDFLRSVYVSVALIGALYLSVAFVTVGTRAYTAGGGVAPFAALLGHVLGPYAADGTAILAVFIIFGVVNAYTAGLSRVFYAVARDGGLPSYLGHLDPSTGAPRRVLLAMMALISVVFALFYVFSIDLATALLLASGAAIGVYILGSAAGIRLHPRIGGAGRASRWLPVAALVISIAVAPFIGWPILATVAVAGSAYAYSRWRSPRKATGPAPD